MGNVSKMYQSNLCSEFIPKTEIKRIGRKEAFFPSQEEPLKFNPKHNFAKK